MANHHAGRNRKSADSALPDLECCSRKVAGQNLSSCNASCTQKQTSQKQDAVIPVHQYREALHAVADLAGKLVVFEWPRYSLAATATNSVLILSLACSTDT